MPARGYTPSVEELHADLEALEVFRAAVQWTGGETTHDWADEFSEERLERAQAWLDAEIERTENTIDGLEAGLGGVVEDDPALSE